AKLDRMSSQSARNVENARAPLKIQSVHKKIHFVPGLFFRHSFPPHIHSQSMKKLLVPFRFHFVSPICEKTYSDSAPDTRRRHLRKERTGYRTADFITSGRLSRQGRLYPVVTE